MRPSRGIDQVENSEMNTVWFISILSLFIFLLSFACVGVLYTISPPEMTITLDKDGRLLEVSGVQLEEQEELGGEKVKRTYSFIEQRGYSSSENETNMLYVPLTNGHAVPVFY